MSDKTKQYKWLPWALAIAISVAIAVGIQMFYHVNWYFLAPWTPAKTLVTTILINEFSTGALDTLPHWDLRLIALASFLLTFIVGLSLWIYAEIENQTKSPSDVLKKGLVWYVGVILIVVSLQVVPTTFIKGVVFKNTWEQTAQSKSEDELRADLMKIGYEAIEHFYLPRELGGGAGSFLTFPADNGQVRPIELNDLDSYKAGSANSYKLAEVNSDSVITIYGIGYKQDSNPKDRNDNERMEKIQIALEVNALPSLRFKNNNVR